MENSVVKQNNVTHTYMHRYNKLHIVSINKHGLHKTKNNKLKSLESPVNLDGEKNPSSPCVMLITGSNTSKGIPFIRQPKNVSWTTPIMGFYINVA